MADFLPAMALIELRPGEITSVEVAGRFLAFYLVDGEAFCSDDFCTHEGSSLSAAGYVVGEEVVCGWHGAQFSVKTGEVTAPPAADAIRTYPVQIRDGIVHVALD